VNDPKGWGERPGGIGIKKVEKKRKKKKKEIKGSMRKDGKGGVVGFQHQETGPAKKEGTFVPDIAGTRKGSDKIINETAGGYFFAWEDEERLFETTIFRGLQ